MSLPALFLRGKAVRVDRVVEHADPPILILDEATSALDTETERAIQQSLAELAQGHTTLIIAHRLATIRHADHIVVVDETGLAEQGRHGDLIAAGGAYRRLHEAQHRA